MIKLILFAIYACCVVESIQHQRPIPPKPIRCYINREFYGTIYIGQPQQKFNILFDTGSSNLWAISQGCSAGKNHNKYNHSKSKTYAKNGTAIELHFGIGNVSGFLSTDTLTIDNIGIHRQVFAEADTISKSILAVKSDGVFGLGYAANAVDDVMTPLDNMFTQNAISGRIFSTYLNRNASASNGGEIIFGGSDPQHFEGDFTYIPVTGGSVWGIRMDSASFNSFTFCRGGCGVLIDTGNAFIKPPRKDAEAINNALGAKRQRKGLYTVACDKLQLPTLNLTFSGKEFRLEGADYILREPGNKRCYSLFKSSNEPYWIVGVPLIGKYYTEFDMERNRIGFATLK